MQSEENALTITLLSLSSLEKHFDYLLVDQHLLNNDILGLTETQLQLTEYTTD